MRVLSPLAACTAQRERARPRAFDCIRPRLGKRRPLPIGDNGVGKEAPKANGDNGELVRPETRRWPVYPAARRSINVPLHPSASHATLTGAQKVRVSSRIVYA
jgi:hypothetical protein